MVPAAPPGSSPHPSDSVLSLDLHSLLMKSECFYLLNSSQTTSTSPTLQNDVFAANGHLCLIVDMKPQIYMSDVELGAGVPLIAFLSSGGNPALGFARSESSALLWLLVPHPSPNLSANAGVSPIRVFPFHCFHPGPNSLLSHQGHGSR